MTPIETTLQHPLFSTQTDFRVALGESVGFEDVGLVIVSTGTCRVQSYGTPAKLRELAASLYVLADAVQRNIQAQEAAP